MLRGFGPFARPRGCVELIAAPMRQRECSIALADARQISGQITQAVSDEMHNLTFALNASVGADHAGGKDDTAVFLEHLYPSG